MIHNNQRWINLLNMLSDAALIFIAYLLSIYIRFDLMRGVNTLNLWATNHLVLAAVAGIAIVLVLYSLHLYRSFRYKRIMSEVRDIVVVNSFAALILISAMYYFHVMDFSRLTVFFIWVFSNLFLLGKHLTGRLILRYYRSKGYNQKHVIVVGNGFLAHQFIEDTKKNTFYGLTVDGYVSGVPREELGICLGSYEDLENILLEKDIDEIVVALEPHESQYMKAVLAAADKEGVRISIIPFYNQYIPSHPTIDVIGHSKLIDMRATPLDSIINSALKRGMDIVGALILIILSSPIMLVTAIGVKLSSPGPILFKQERIGKNKKPFKMLKFRSMKVTGTETTGWSKDVDPRKTKFGSFIRKCSIDELPQFFNVLIGQMSLIGPRPEVPFHVEHFKEEIPLYLVRQQVRPGITGWAQVNGLRGDTSIEERVKYDIWYIENWSLGLDLRILFKTAFGGMINSEKVVK